MKVHSNTSRTQSNRFFWGVDVASAKLDLGCHGVEEVLTFKNSPSGIAQLVEHVRASGSAMITIEATGGYEIPLVTALDQASLPVVVINPRQLRAYATAVGELAKTDHIDARIIARFAHDVRPEFREIPEEKQRLFADLATRRAQLIGLRTAEKNRLKQCRHPEIRASIEAMIQTLNAQIAQIEKQLADSIKSCEAWRRQDEIIQSVAGVAASTSHVLLAELPELGKLNHKKIAKLVGVAPLCRDSGTFRGKRAIFGGRNSVRNAIYMAAFNAMRCNMQIRVFYERLRQAGKPFKVAITACMRKLLTIINALIRDQTIWKNPINTT